MASHVLIAAAAALMASGLLMAGTGAALALAAPEPGGGGDTSGPQGSGATPGTDDPATATTGAQVRGGVSAGAGTAEAESKPGPKVGDGRNGQPTGSTATGTGTAPTREVPRNTEVAPTTIVTEPSSKPGEAESALTAPTGGATFGEETPGSAPRLVNGIEGTADVLPAGGKRSESSDTTQPTTSTVPTGEVPPAGEWGNPKDPPKEQHPGLGWPWSWSWWDQCLPLGLPPGSVGGSDGTHTPPVWTPPLPRAMQLPIPYPPREIVSELRGILEPFLDAVTGLATAASEVPFAQITLPVIVVPSFPAGTGAPGGGAGGGAGSAGGPGLVPRPGIPAAPKPPRTTHGEVSKPPAQSGRRQESPPAFSAGNQALAAPSYRMGYAEYLRAAGLGQVAAVAVPGLSGILILTGAGGLIGYRQARAGRSVRSGITGRFMG